MAERKNKPTVSVSSDMEQRRNESLEAERMAMQEEMRRAMTTPSVQVQAPTQKGGVGRPKKMKIHISNSRPLQVSTHYTYDVKEKVEDVVRRMKREGVKTASNEEVIFIAVSEWLEKFGDTLTVERFLEYRKELEE